MSKPKPPIDRQAETVPVFDPPPTQPPADVPMPTAENALPSIFRPTKEIGAVDVFEIALMYLLALTNSPVNLNKGQLRTLGLPADRVGQLSDSAQRFMAEVQAEPAPPATGPVQ